MGAGLGVEVPWEGLLEATPSRRQLHDPRGHVGWKPESEPQHRTQVKPREAGLSGLACYATRRPISSRGRTVQRTVRRDILRSYPGRSPRVRGSGREEGGNDNFPMPVERSDHFIRAKKLGNASGAKEVMD